jgi:predicted permease
MFTWLENVLAAYPSVERVTVLLLIVFVGMITAKAGILDGHVRRKLSDLLIYVTTPLLVISAFSLEFSPERLTQAGVVALISLGVHIFAILLGAVLFRNGRPEQRAVMRYILVFSNSGFMGLPVLASLWGSTGVFYGAIYNLVSDLFLWTFGVMLFQTRNARRIQRALINPGTIAVAVGMLIFLFSLDISDPLAQAVELVGGLTAPLSMLVIGALLMEDDLKRIFTGLQVYYVSFLRLVVIPLVVMLLLKGLGPAGEVGAASVALAAMPAAANTVIFAEKFGGDAVFASRCVALSTLLSMITIPLLLLPFA